jgi:hypothetical protein
LNILEYKNKFRVTKIKKNDYSDCNNDIDIDSDSSDSSDSDSDSSTDSDNDNELDEYTKILQLVSEYKLENVALKMMECIKKSDIIDKNHEFLIDIYVKYIKNMAIREINNTEEINNNLKQLESIESKIKNITKKNE